MLPLFVPLSDSRAQAQAAKPCCSITAVNQQDGFVSARVNASGQTFEFKLANPELLRALKPGQSVYANFQAKSISLDGQHVAGTILRLSPVQAAPQSSEACCEVTATNRATGLVLVKEIASGHTFQLRIKDSTQLGSLKPGQRINFAVAPSATPTGSQQSRGDTSAEPSNQVPPLSFGAREKQLGVWFFSHGGAFHSSTDPTRPAILLVHGLHGSARAWMKPADDPGVGEYFYDFHHTPSQVREKSSTPNEGVFKIGKSDKSAVQINAANWFDFLASQNFTVATWDQPGETFAQAYSGNGVCTMPTPTDCPSAQQAYQQFLAATQTLNPAAPPPVALLGHSRGGLVIRQLLKDYGSQGRVKWVITLHSPHSGSELAIAPEKLKTQVEILCSTPVVVEGLEPWLAAVSVMCYDSLESFIKEQLTPGQRELAPGGPVLGPLASGEAKLPEVMYYTFGGTSPTYLRFYAWFLTPNSGIPQFECDHSIPPNCEMYFKWVANASELPGISPMLGALPDHFVPEITPGKGDGLVADARSRLPFTSTHITDNLNHAEVLWDVNVQQHVAQILSGVRVQPNLVPGTRR